MKTLKKLAKNFLKRLGVEIRRGFTVPVNVRRMKELLYLEKMFSRISGVGGNVAECGVGKGRTFLSLAFLAEREGGNRKLWGFDSFEGFPEPSREDLSSRNPQAGEWSGTSVEDIKKILKDAGINKKFLEENVKIIKGFFEKSLADYDNSPIALLHIDVDLYKSYLSVLQKMFPLVVKDGLVLFDEYGEERWPGATKAVDEFFGNTGPKPQFDEKFGKYFLVKT